MNFDETFQQWQRVRCAFQVFATSARPILTTLANGQKGFAGLLAELDGLHASLDSLRGELAEAAWHVRKGRVHETIGSRWLGELGLEIERAEKKLFEIRLSYARMATASEYRN